jgi:hypothetical protein
MLKDEDVLETFVFRFSSPCESFKSFGTGNKTSAFFVDSCERDLESHVMTPLESLCHPPFPQEVRPKGLNTIAGVYSSIFGIMSQKLNPNQDPVLAKALQNLVTELGNITQSESDENLEYLEYLTKELGISIGDLKDSGTETLLPAFGTTITLNAKLAAYFQLAKSHLSTVKEEWAVSKFSFKLFQGTYKILNTVYPLYV